MNKIKEQFSIFKNHPSLVYLDNAASTQTPDIVVEKMTQYYSAYRANIHRGLYQISEQATEQYESARKIIADFIGAETNEIIFASGATFGLNMLAYSFSKNLKPGDNVVLTKMEHHANLVPWQEMAKQYGFELRFIDLENYQLDLEDAKRKIDQNTKLVSFCSVSNTLGTVNQSKELIEIANSVGAMTVVDAAQEIAHRKINVKEIDCDFLVFSGHKMYGPTGIGVVYGKKERLENLDPFLFGGDMISEVSFEKSSWAEIPNKFEAGTPNIAGAIGLATAVEFINEIGFDKIIEHEKELTEYLLAELKKLEFVEIIGTQDLEKRIGVVSFNIKDVHPHDVADILDKTGVAVRAGHHCTMPLIKELCLVGTVRASMGIYNDKKDVDQLILGIKKVKEVFK